MGQPLQSRPGRRLGGQPFFWPRCSARYRAWLASANPEGGKPRRRPGSSLTSPTMLARGSRWPAGAGGYEHLELRWGAQPRTAAVPDRRVGRPFWEPLGPTLCQISWCQLVQPRASTRSVPTTSPPRTATTKSTMFQTTQTWFGTTRTISPIEGPCPHDISRKPCSSIRRGI